MSQYRADRINEPRHRLVGLPLYDANGIPLAASDRRQLGTDWLISYEPTPGTVAYVGYGDGLPSAGTLADTRMRRVNDGIFVKLSYLFRR